MPATRSSARQAAGAAAGSSPSSSQSKEADNATSGSKRKAGPVTSPKAKRGKKGDQKEQTTLEETMPREDTQDVDMADQNAQKTEVAANEDKEAGDKAAENTKVGKEDDKEMKTDEKGADAPEDGENAFKEMMKENDSTKEEPEEATGGSNVANGDNAVESSSKREESTPSSILEKGIIYFFERGRVGIDEPSSTDEIARSYIVLRPMPHGSKLGEGPIGDEGNNRLLALPKKVLPKSPKDRFMSFVEKAKVSLDDIKTNFGASEYATKTAGTRHTPPMAPIGEGVYAITSTGRESHLAYILTIPSDISEVQRDIGLQQRGSFITSIKNPSQSGPANANLPQGPEFPQELLDEFHGLRWMPLQPKFLDYANAQILLIGHQEGALEKATDKEPEGDDEGKDKPLEEMEKLEDEDQIRVEHLKGDDSVFIDLGLHSKDYPKVQTTW